MTYALDAHWSESNTSESIDLQVKSLQGERCLHFTKGAFQEVLLEGLKNSRAADDSDLVPPATVEEARRGAGLPPSPLDSPLIYFRGSTRLVNGVARIQVPSDFAMVTGRQGITVQVTPRGPVLLWTEAPNLREIVVHGDQDVEFDYFVNGVRAGFRDVQTVVENEFFRPSVRGLPYGMEYAPAYRQLLVNNGIMNPDFTPNESTAARLNWKLREPTQRELANLAAARKLEVDQR